MFKAIIILGGVFVFSFLPSCLGDLSLIDTNNHDIKSYSTHPKIIKQAENFYTAKIDIDGTALYLGFDRVDDTNRKFWEAYRSQADRVAKELSFYPKRTRENDARLTFPNALSDFLGYSEEEHKKIIDFLVKSPKNQNIITEENYFYKLFSDMSGEFAGMDLGDFKQRTPNRSYYVVYGSYIPIVKRFLNNDFDKNKKYKDNFQRIAISMAAITAHDVPTVTHTGFTDNPLEFLKDKSSPTMILHGFAARVWLEFFSNKKYMITQLLPSNNNTLSLKIDKKNIWEGVYPEELNGLKAKNIDFDFSYFTIGAKRTTVLLSELVQFFTAEK